MSRSISVVIGLAGTFVFLASAPAAAAAESAVMPDLAVAVEHGVSMDGMLVVAIGAAVGIAVLVVGLMLVSEMMSLVRNPIVRSGRRPVRR